MQLPSANGQDCATKSPEPERAGREDPVDSALLLDWLLVDRFRSPGLEWLSGCVLKQKRAQSSAGP